MSRTKYLLLSLVLLFPFFVSHSFAHSWMAPREAAERENPVAADTSSTSVGQELYGKNCMMCHGPDGRGLSAAEARLSKGPPDLVGRLENHSHGDFFWKIQKGRGEMPGFQEILEERQIWHIINFIDSRSGH